MSKPIHCPKCASERGVAIPAKCPHKPAVTDEQILEEIETHADNGVPPFSLPELVSEILDVPQARVRKLAQKWWQGE